MNKLAKMKNVAKKLIMILSCFCLYVYQSSELFHMNMALENDANQTQYSILELNADSGIDYTMKSRN